MEANIGSLDRIIRITVGLLLIWLAYSQPGYGWAWLGVFPLASGYLRHCPIYKRFYFTTCKHLRDR